SVWIPTLSNKKKQRLQMRGQLQNPRKTYSFGKIKNPLAEASGEFYRTILTIFLGTTMTFLGVLPSSHFWTTSFARACASISSLLRFTAKGNLTRTLPLIDTGYSCTFSSK